ncbi:MAG: PAS-domain containing protein [Rhodospirillaceae bacterium]|nr:PAS-domain containing protein [Rhodospirillaceae bacterium]
MPDLTDTVLAGPVLVGLLAALMLIPPAAAIFWRQHRHWRRAEREREASERAAAGLRAALETAPDGHFIWFHDPGAADPGAETTGGACSRRLAVLLDLLRGRSAGFADVVACFDAASQDRLGAAVQSLRAEGQGFALDLTLAGGGRRIAARGLRAADDAGAALADVVWMSDVTEGAAAVETLNDERDRLGRDRALLAAALDGIDVPVWLRDDDLSLIYCNRAYVKAVDGADATDVVNRGREIAPRVAVREARALAAAARAAGETRRAAFHMVLDGTRRMVEVTESPVTLTGRDESERAESGRAEGGGEASLFSDGSGRLTAGIAYDITRQEELETRLRRAQAAQSDVLERLGTAIAIFAADTRMVFHNTAFARLWKLEPAWLAEAPTYAALLDALRAQRRLPEVADFPAFKDKELSRFNSLIDPLEDVLHLPDGGSLRRVVAPHPLGGLLTTYEDVTDKLALERSYNTLIAVQRETIDNLQEAVAVFGADGSLRIANPAFADLWGLSLDALAENPGLASVVDAFADMFDDAGVFARHRALLLGALDPDRQRITQQGRLVRSAGSVLEFVAVPLPDGGILFCYNDVSAPERAAQTLRGRAEVLAAGERLKSDLAIRLSAECAAAIDGIAALAGEIAEAAGPTPSRAAAAEIVTLAQDVAGVLAETHDLAGVDLMQQAPRLDTVDVANAIARTLRLVRHAALEHGCELAVDVAGSVGWVVADATRFRLVLFLMLSAAIDASAGPLLKLDARRRSADGVLETRLRFNRGRDERAGAGRVTLDLARRLATLDGGTLSDDGDGIAAVLTWRHPLGTLPASRPAGPALAAKVGLR